MGKLLTQEEIDALLNQDKYVDPSSIFAEKEKEARPYDFRHPDRVSKEQLKILRNIHDNFARQISTYLSNQLRVMIDVKAPTIEQVTYFEFTLSAAAFTYMYVFTLDGFEGSAILELDPKFTFFIIDRSFGGLGTSISKDEKAPTIIERSVIQKNAEKILDFLKESWSHVEQLEPTITTFETNPQLVTVAPASETMVVLNFPVTAKNFEFSIVLCFPYFMLEPILKKFTSQDYLTLMRKQPSHDDAESLQRTVLMTDIVFSVELGKTKLSVQDFIDLQENELLLLDTRIEDPLIARIQKHKKFIVSPGKKGRQRVVRIDNLIDEEGDIV